MRRRRVKATLRNDDTSRLASFFLLFPFLFTLASRRKEPGVSRDAPPPTSRLILALVSPLFADFSNSAFPSGGLMGAELILLGDRIVSGIVVGDGGSSSQYFSPDSVLAS